MGLPPRDGDQDTVASPKGAERSRNLSRAGALHLAEKRDDVTCRQAGASGDARWLDARDLDAHRSPPSHFKSEPSFIYLCSEECSFDGEVAYLTASAHPQRERLSNNQARDACVPLFAAREFVAIYGLDDIAHDECSPPGSVAANPRDDDANLRSRQRCDPFG